MYNKLGTLRHRIWIIPTAILVSLILVAQSIVIVPAGSVGVITQWGAVNRVVYPGMSLKFPIAEGYVAMDVRTLKNQVDVGAASKDLQTVTSTIAVNYRLDGKYAADVYQSVGINYKEVLIDPAVENIFKATTAKYTAEELITKREEVRLAAEESLAKQLVDYHIIVENFNIVNFDFSPEFNNAIEAKQVAQQEVETAKQKLARAEVEAETARTQAQGQADSQKILRDGGALTPEYLRYLALTKWDGRLPTVTGGAVPFIDVTP
jgi:regulator of protease activity HflC (stomatin/prohibitin superfamily)